MCIVDNEAEGGTSDEAKWRIVTGVADAEAEDETKWRIIMRG